MPALQHPRPVRSSHHEILVQGYGNGLNTVTFVAQSERNQLDPSDAGSAAEESGEVAELGARADSEGAGDELVKGREQARALSAGGLNGRMPSCWSHSSGEDEEEEGEQASESRRSDSSGSDVQYEIKPLNLGKTGGRIMSMRTLEQMVRRGMGDDWESVCTEGGEVVVGEGEEEGGEVLKGMVGSADSQDGMRHLEKDEEKEREEITLLEALKEGLVLC